MAARGAGAAAGDAGDRVSQQRFAGIDFREIPGSASTRACRKLVMSKGRMSRSSTVGPTVNMTGCRRWRPTGAPSGRCDRARRPARTLPQRSATTRRFRSSSQRRATRSRRASSLASTGRAAMSPAYYFSTGLAEATGAAYASWCPTPTYCASRQPEQSAMPRVMIERRAATAALNSACKSMSSKPAATSEFEAAFATLGRTRAGRPPRQRPTRSSTAANRIIALAGAPRAPRDLSSSANTPRPAA